MFKKVLIILAIGLVALLATAAFQSPDYLISREVTINKSANVIFPYLNVPKMMELWSPWTEMDPQVKMSYAGPEAGVGSIASWDSSGRMGTGSATIFESVPQEVVRTKIEYTKPFQMVQESEFSVKANGSQSIVKWAVKGQNTFIGRVMSIFMNMDKMVGASFEKGLSKLKTIVESKNEP